jgi:phosphoglycerol transferase MdoB-like AlkP superfamily enzyme
MFPLLIFINLERINYFSNNSSLHRVVSALPSVLLSYIFILFLIIMLFTLIYDLFISTLIVSVILYIFYLISFYRKLVTGWVFVPTDITFLNNMSSLADITSISIEWRLIVPTVATILLLTALFVLNRLYLKQYERANRYLMRIVIFIITGVGFSILFLTSFSKYYIMPALGVDVRVKYTNNQVYDKHGAIMGFYIAYDYNSVQAPEGYNRKELEILQASIDAEAYVKEAHQSKPNVIVILSEAFSDPTIWPNLSFSQEPLKNFKELSAKYTSGKFITPSFGGSTANVEYEFVTGIPYIFTGHGSLPYNEPDIYFKNDVVYALPYIYESNGYSTVAIHSYNRTFFNRDKIYKKMGFDKFIGMEDMTDSYNRGSYISDEYLTDKIIEQLENKQDDEPLFVWAITMANHYPYTEDKYADDEKNGITSTSSQLTREQLDSVDSYLNGIVDADIQLKRLVDYLEGQEEDTIVVFYGDHLPIVGEQAFDIYTSLGYIDSDDNIEWSTEEYYKMYSTNYLVYNNYGLQSQNLGDVSPYFLANHLLNISEVYKPLYFHFLDKAYESFSAMINNVYVKNF